MMRCLVKKVLGLLLSCCMLTVLLPQGMLAEERPAGLTSEQYYEILEQTIAEYQEAVRPLSEEELLELEQKKLEFGAFLDAQNERRNVAATLSETEPEGETPAPTGHKVQTTVTGTAFREFIMLDRLDAFRERYGYDFNEMDYSVSKIGSSSQPLTGKIDDSGSFSFFLGEDMEPGRYRIRFYTSVDITREIEFTVIASDFPLTIEIGDPDFPVVVSPADPINRNGRLDPAEYQQLQRMVGEIRGVNVPSNFDYNADGYFDFSIRESNPNMV